MLQLVFLFFVFFFQIHLTWEMVDTLEMRLSYAFISTKSPFAAWPNSRSMNHRKHGGESTIMIHLTLHSVFFHFCLIDLIEIIRRNPQKFKLPSLSIFPSHEYCHLFLRYLLLWIYKVIKSDNSLVEKNVHLTIGIQEEEKDEPTRFNVESLWFAVISNKQMATAILNTS